MENPRKERERESEELKKSQRIEVWHVPLSPITVCVAVCMLIERDGPVCVSECNTLPARLTCVCVNECYTFLARFRC